MMIKYIILVAIIICAFIESKTTAPYKERNVYGRFTAYIATDFLFCGISLLIFDSTRNYIGMNNLGLTILVAFIMIAVSVLLMLNALKKCPAEMKSKCIPSMLITGFGVTAKIFVFFIPAVWRLPKSDSTR